MCGIIGYVGPKKALAIVLEGLERLEYRGYDSIGVLIYDENEKEVYLKKQVGRIQEFIKTVQLDKEGGLGIGHCLHPETVIQLIDGRTAKISQIRDGDRVINLDTNRLSLAIGNIMVHRHLSPSQLYQVKTPLTNYIASAEHKTLVYKNGKITEKSIRELEIGDLLPFPRKIIVRDAKPICFQPIFVKRYYRLKKGGWRHLVSQLQSYQRKEVLAGTDISSSYFDHFLSNDRNFREDKLNSLLSFLKQDCEQFFRLHLEPINTIHGKYLILPQISSLQSMQFFGYFLGDGHAGEKSTRFKDMDRNVLNTYRQLISKIFNLKGVIRSMKDTRAELLEVNSYYFSQWLKENVVKDKSGFISKVGSLPPEELSAFIRGLFDAEGCINEKSKQLYLAMNDEFLIRSLQLYLLRFGVIASLQVVKPNIEQKRKNQTFKLSISNKDSLVSFQKLIGFSGQRKKQKLRRIILTVGNKHFSFRFLNNQEVILTRVKKIERIKSNTQFVYDLEVDNHPNFLANGIFTHNSRWATHGGVSIENAHPHGDCSKKIFVVHNGIIENFQDLKSSLVEKGHVFISQTDTEVVPHLIEEWQKQGLGYREAIMQTLKDIRGSFALLIFNQDEPDLIVGTRFSSPLILGTNDREFIFASDPTPVGLVTKNVIYLNDGDVAFVSENGYELQSFLTEKSEAKKGIIDSTLGETDKGEFPDFMLKEIFEEPQALENTLRGRIMTEEGRVKLGGLEPLEQRLREINRVILVACGTASYAALAAKYFFEECAEIPTEADLGSEFRYRKPIIDNRTLFVAISQSGETADTLAAIKEAKTKGALTLGIVNVVGSSIARAVEAGIYSHAGAELAVASTKAFVTQVADLVLLMTFLARERKMSLVAGKEIMTELLELPEKMRSILLQAEKIRALAEKYSGYKNFFYLGRKYNFPIALEGSLKLKECAYIHSEAYPAGEMKHGPIALIDGNFPSIVLAPRDSVYEKVVSNIQEIKARKGKVIAVTTAGNQELEKLVDNVIYIPETLEILTPLLAVVPLHLFAYYLAKKLGRDVDRPRNLAKSVTVE